MTTGSELVDWFLESLDARIVGTIGGDTPEQREVMRVMRPTVRAKLIADPEWAEQEIVGILAMFEGILAMFDDD